MSRGEQYQWWRDALRGVFGAITEASPQSGFYRCAGEPVAIWREGADIYCVIGSEYADRDPAETWLKCAKFPVSEDAYQARIETGKWPGDVAPANAAPGHNNPPAIAHEALSLETAEQWLAGHPSISDQVAADEAANMRAALLEMSKQADGAREKEKAPHMASCRQIDAKWAPHVRRPKEIADKLRGMLTAWLNSQKPVKIEQAAQAIAQGAEPARIDTAPKAGGARGRRAALRTERFAVIDDMKALVASLADHPEITELAARIAQRSAKNGVPLAGTHIEERQVAA